MTHQTDNFISVVILEAYMEQLPIFNLWIYCRNCCPLCGANSHILVSSSCSSKMKREKSSPEKHFILIKTWNNSRRNSEHPKGCSSSCWLHKSQRTGCTDCLEGFFSGPFRILQLLARSVSWMCFWKWGRIKEQMVLSWLCQSSATGRIFLCQ